MVELSFEVRRGLTEVNVIARWSVGLELSLKPAAQLNLGQPVTELNLVRPAAELNHVACGAAKLNLLACRMAELNLVA